MSKYKTPLSKSKAQKKLNQYISKLNRFKKANRNDFYDETIKDGYHFGLDPKLDAEYFHKKMWGKP